MNDLTRNIASIGFFIALCGMALAVRSARRNMIRNKKKIDDIEYVPLTK